MPTIVKTAQGHISIHNGQISFDYGTPEEQELRRFAMLMHLGLEPELQMAYFPGRADFDNACGEVLARALEGEVIQRRRVRRPKASDPDELVLRPVIH